MSRLRLFIRRTGALSALMSCCCWAVGMVHAEQDLKGIADPTLPPASVMSKQSGGTPSASASASGASAPDGGEAVEKPKPVALTLQAIRYDLVNGQAVAMINDELVQVGDKVAGMSVVSISRNVAVLKGASGVRRLSLLDEAEEMSPKFKHEPGGAAKRGRKESK